MEGKENGDNAQFQTEQSWRELIIERKSEKQKLARRKLAEDLELIKRRNKSPEGSYPALELLPKEMWCKILDDISLPNDIRNVRETCSLFQEVLGDKYFSKVLLPTVLATDSLRKALLEPKKRHRDTRFIEARHQLHKLRFVNSKWKGGVDQFFQNTVQKPTESLNLDRLGLSPRFCASYRDTQRLDRIIQNFCEDTDEEDTKAKLFFTRSISISIPIYCSMNAAELVELIPSVHFSKLPRLLGVVGEQILRFEYFFVFNTFVQAGIPLSGAYLAFLHLLSFMPNLKSLTWGHEKTHLPPPSLPSEEVQGLRECIAANPFPALGQLDTFKLFMGRNSSHVEAESIFIQAGLRSNPQIKDLTISTRRILQDEALTASIHALTQVESVSVESEHWALNEMPPILSPTWPLKKIKLEDLSHWTMTNLSVVFRFLERFPTLEHVDLQFEDMVLEDPGYLQLPNVKLFTIVFGGDIEDDDDKNGDEEDDRSPSEVEDFLLSLDFLFPLKRLESLEWRCRIPPENDEVVNVNDDEAWTHELIQFRRGLMNLNHSNIWDVFPSLKTIIVDPYFSDRPYFSDKNVPKAKLYTRGSRDAGGIVTESDSEDNSSSSETDNSEDDEEEGEGVDEGELQDLARMMEEEVVPP